MGIINSLTRIALPMVVTVATGGAAAPLVLQQMAVRAALNVAIQYAGQRMNLPMSIINMAQGVAAGQMSGGSFDYSSYGGSQGFLNEIGAQMPPSIAGGFFRDIADLSNQAATLADTANAYEKMADSFLLIGNKAMSDYFRGQADNATSQRNQIQNYINELNTSRDREQLDRDINNVKNSKGMSILMKIAIIMGKIADGKMNEMAKKAEQIGDFGKVSEKNQGKFSELNAQMSALGQEFSVVTQAMNSVIKSIGEGQSTLARKN